MKYNIVFFDADQTLWTNIHNKYISSVVGELELVDKYNIRRVDGEIFTLHPETRVVFDQLKTAGTIIGIVSDNVPVMVIDALKLFELWSMINIDAVNIKLWDGYCPKHLMIEEILLKDMYINIARKNICWCDDKDYSKEAKQIGVNFCICQEKLEIK